MVAARRMLLVTRDPETVEQVTGALGSLAPANGWVCASLGELRSRLDEQRVDATLVDLGPSPERTLRELADIASRYPELRLVVLAGEVRSDLLMGAMNAGVRRFVLKTSLRQDLAKVLEALTPPAQSAGRAAAGRVLTILSAGGGCGATTLAINLSHELGLSSGSPTLLVDLDTAYGGVASQLGLAGRYGAAEVFRPAGPVDGELVASATRIFSPQVHVLLSPASVNPLSPAALGSDRIDEVLRAFQAAYAHTVVDAARVEMSAAARLVRGSEQTLLVFQLNLKDLSRARVVLDCLAQSGVPASAVTGLVNRYQRRSRSVRLEEAEKALGLPLRRVRNDFAGAMRGLNLGRPLAEAAPRSPVRKDIRALAGQLSHSASPANPR